MTQEDIKYYLRQIYKIFCLLFFDPLEMISKWRGIPYYVRNKIYYQKINTNPLFGFRWSNAYPALTDRFKQAGAARGHYFWQDLWATQYLYNNNVKNHVDVGSRIDGFIAHVLTFCEVTYVDIRSFDAEIHNFRFKQGSILKMPFEDNSIHSLSSLHVIEHIGLGRYGDPVDPEGHIKAAKELTRILTHDGVLLIGTPVGRERLCFDAHRIFDPSTILDIFSELKMLEFSLIDDKGLRILSNASFDDARLCDYGCGLFVFTKH